MGDWSRVVKTWVEYRRMGWAQAKLVAQLSHTIRLRVCRTQVRVELPVASFTFRLDGRQHGMVPLQVSAPRGASYICERRTLRSVVVRMHGLTPGEPWRLQLEVSPDGETLRLTHSHEDYRLESILRRVGGPAAADAAWVEAIPSRRVRKTTSRDSSSSPSSLGSVSEDESPSASEGASESEGASASESEGEGKESRCGGGEAGAKGTRRRLSLRAMLGCVGASRTSAPRGRVAACRG